ncbi:MAG TPA: hypothetical protein VE344_00415 [Methylomirabilota bacterium]|nr:hypothetical protein [Methylomirabilota bacterium]
MELKVVCGCGQKYKFDVEPVNGRMPMTVNCPSCGVDGTHTANNVLAESFPNQPPPIPVAMAVPTATAAAPIASGLRINSIAPATISAPPPLTAPRPIAPLKPLSTAPKAPSKDFNMGMGILGAFLGAIVGGVLVYGFYEWVGFRFPWSGIGIGALSGYGARWLGRGTHTTLGIIAGGLALASVLGAFYLMYGEFAIFNIISIILCVGVAYRVASE